MRHVLIVCSPRAGGTWLGKLLDTCPEVKYLWEADHPKFHGTRNMMNWPLNDEDRFRRMVLDFVPHVDIKPHFPKTDVEVAVYKMAHAFPQLASNGARVGSWGPEHLLTTREMLDAKIIHLVRHPVRWAASVHRWSPRSAEVMISSLDLYTRSNLDFWRSHSGKPWYRAVAHDKLTIEPRLGIEPILDFCGLAPSPALEGYLELMHSFDSTGSPHLHETIIRPATVLNRWKEYDQPDVIAHADDLVREVWDGLFDPLTPGLQGSLDGAKTKATKEV